MSNADLARKIRDAIYERSNEEGGAISREQMDDAIERALNADKPANPYAGGVYFMTTDIGDVALINGSAMYRLSHTEIVA